MTVSSMVIIKLPKPMYCLQHYVLRIKDHDIQNTTKKYLIPLQGYQKIQVQL